MFIFCEPKGIFVNLSLPIAQKNSAMGLQMDGHRPYKSCMSVNCLAIINSEKYKSFMQM